MDDDGGVRYWQEAGQEQELMYHEALDRIVAGTWDKDDLRTLAFGLGIDYRPPTIHAGQRNLF